MSSTQIERSYAQNTPKTSHEIGERRASTVRTSERRKKAGKWLAVGSGVVASWVGVQLLNEHNHIKGASSLAALKAEIGHVPSGIISIKPTDDPNVQSVHYMVQNKPEDIFVSSVAADLHPMAPNQAPQDEFSAINTYLEKPNELSGGQELDILVNTDSGQILADPRPSVENNG